MNRRVFLLAALSIALLVPACRENKQMPKGSGFQAARSTEGASIDTVDDSLRLDSLFETIWALECAVAEKPGNRKNAGKLLAKSLDTVAGCFYVVGKGLKNPELSDEAQSAAWLTAAKCSAEKWAFYLKSLYAGEEAACSALLSGKVLYKKDLRTRVVDDSLFVLVMVPLGSVVVKEK